MSPGLQKLLWGCFGGVVGGVLGMLVVIASMVFFMDGLIIAGRRPPAWLQFYGPIVVGVLLGAVRASRGPGPDSPRKPGG